MTPAGYMAKRVQAPVGFHADGVRVNQPRTNIEIGTPNGGTSRDVYSVSNCVNDDFAEYIQYWKHNGYWLFDSPEIIQGVAQDNHIQLKGTSLFYYEVYEKEFDGKNWLLYQPEASFPTNVVVPSQKVLEGFDVVTFFARSSPECSPLSCNGMAGEIPTNDRCLLVSFEEAYAKITSGAFNQAELGPYRIFAVYSVPWNSGS